MPEAPLTTEELITNWGGRNPETSAPTDLTIAMDVGVTNASSSQVSASTTDYPEAIAYATSLGDEMVTSGVQVSNVEVSFTAGALGVRAFPANVEATEVAVPDLSIPDVLAAAEQGLDGFVPTYLGLRPAPLPLEEALMVWPAFDSTAELAEGEEYATTVFPPDERTVYSDTSYPWGTIGRVETAGGVASGALVGPRHLLTVSHTVTWNADNTAGWLKFTPGYFDGNAPFGNASAERFYSYVKVTGPTIDENEGRHDYCVVVLNRRLGDVCGWMGTRAYTDDWDGTASWSHAGYPGDITATQRPIYQGGISLDGDDNQDDANQRIGHLGDVWPGQSGGPFFAWWGGESFPRVVAVQSGQTPAQNSASGGQYIVNLLQQALTDFP